MAKTKSTYTEEQQEAIDKGWQLYNTAMEACEELEGYLHDLSEDHGIDTDRANEAAGEAHSALENVYSCGESILPPHTNDKGRVT